MFDALGILLDCGIGLAIFAGSVTLACSGFCATTEPASSWLNALFVNVSQTMLGANVQHGILSEMSAVQIGI